MAKKVSIGYKKWVVKLLLKSSQKKLVVQLVVRKLTNSLENVNGHKIVSAGCH